MLDYFLFLFLHVTYSKHVDFDNVCMLIEQNMYHVLHAVLNKSSISSTTCWCRG